MPQLRTTDHSQTPPRVSVPRDFNFAHDIIERNLAAGRGAKIAYIDDLGEYSYQDLAQRVNRAANALTTLGLAQEDRITICLLDGIDFPAVFLGAIKAGVIPIATNTLLTSRDYDFMLADSRSPHQLSTGELRFQLVWRSLIAAAISGVALPLLMPWPPSFSAGLMFGLMMLLFLIVVRGGWRAAGELRRRRA